MKIMSKIKAKWYQNQVNSRQERLQEQKQLLSRLNEDHAIVTDPAVKLEREIQIKRAKAEIEQIDNDVYLLKSALATGDDSKIPEQCKPKPAEKNTARRDQLDLLDNVKKGWIEGVLRQSLHNEVLIELKKTYDEAAVDRLQQNQPLNVTRVTDEAKPEQAVLLEDDIQEIYEEGKRTLLILGAPGAGKTISLLELTHRLAEDAEFDASQPIPVVFNLSSWAEKQQPLQDWLLDELWNKYRVSNKIGKGCLENDALVLLLDGLDEVAAGQRDACVQAINIYREKYAQKGIVVACRIQEYRELADKLKLEQALCVQPLTEEQIKNYLAAGGEELAGLRTALESDAALQELASSPLMLSMMCLAYQHQTQEAVLQDVSGTAETRRTKLFAAYVQRMFQRPRSGIEYKKEKTRRWLTFLAHNMQKHGQAIFQLENLQPSWLLTKCGYWLYMMLSHSAIGLLIIVSIFSVIMFPGKKMAAELIINYYDFKIEDISFLGWTLMILSLIAITTQIIICIQKRKNGIVEFFVYTVKISSLVSIIYFITFCLFLISVSSYTEVVGGSGGFFSFIFPMIFVCILFGLITGFLLWIINTIFSLKIKTSDKREINHVKNYRLITKLFFILQTLGVVLGLINFLLINRSSFYSHDISDNKEISFSKQSNMQIKEASFSPDGSLIISRDANEKRVLWTRYGKKLHEMEGEIWFVAFSPDSKLLIAVYNDGKKTLWTPDGKKFNQLGDNFRDVEFSMDGTLIATVDDNGKGIVWTRDGKKLYEIGEKLKYVTFSPDSTLIVTTDAYQNETLWRRNGGKNNTFGEYLKYIEFSSDNAFVFTIDSHKQGVLWASDGDKLNEFGKNIKYVEFSPDSRWIFTLDSENKGYLWNQKGVMIKDFGSMPEIFPVIFSPDSAFIVTQSSIFSKKTLFMGTNGLWWNEIGSNLRDVKFSQDGTLFATIDEDDAEGKVVIHSVSNDEKKSIGKNIKYCIFIQNSALIATIDTNNKVVSWTRDGEKINELGEDIIYFQFSPDGKTVLLCRYNFGPVVLLTWVIASFVIALVASLRTNMVQISTNRPNEGIWRALNSSLLLGIGAGIVIGLVFTFAEWQISLISIGLLNTFVLGMFCGLPVAMWFGLLDFLKHFTLRFVLWLYGYAPWNYARFLDHATDRLFLRKVGGGYIFVHRLLLEYFAADETQLNLLFKKKTPQQQA